MRRNRQDARNRQGRQERRHLLFGIRSRLLADLAFFWRPGGFFSSPSKQRTDDLADSVRWSPPIGGLRAPLSRVPRSPGVGCQAALKESLEVGIDDSVPLRVLAARVLLE